MTHDTTRCLRGRRRAGPGSASPSWRRPRSACPARWRGADGRGLVPGRRGAVRILLGAVVLAVPAAVALRGRWALLRAQPPARGLRPARGRRLPARVLQRRERHAGRGRAADRVHVAGGRHRLAVAPPRPAPDARSPWSARSSPSPGWCWCSTSSRPAPVDGLGIIWALGAMVGGAVLLPDLRAEDDGLPPIVLAAAGLVGRGLGARCSRAWSACCPSRADRRRRVVPRRHRAVVAAGARPGRGHRRAGLRHRDRRHPRGSAPRLASFVALPEVLSALVSRGCCWARPRAVQLLGGALVLAGVVMVKSASPRPPLDAASRPSWRGSQTSRTSSRIEAAVGIASRRRPRRGARPRSARRSR